jgi:hypothetical protein
MNELEAFHQFISDKLADGGSLLTPEECVDLWRAQNPADEELRAGAAAIKEALDDLEAGDLGVPFSEFMAEFKAKKRLPP